MYEDDTTDVKGGLGDNTKDDEYPDMDTGLDRDIPTPKVNDSYVKGSVTLQRGNSYARGEFIVWKRDSDGNAVGKTNDNPILDTREYRIEFDDEEVRKMTENVIADSMYDA